MRNPLKTDPQRLTQERKRFLSQMRSRFDALARDIRKLVVEEDAFGLKPKNQFVLTSNTRWQFQTSDAKLKSYQRWLDSQVEAGILEERSDDGWTTVHIESAYKKAKVRAYARELKSTKKDRDFYQGGTTAFAVDSFSDGAEETAIRLLATRTFEQLNGITKTMSSRMARELADGLAHGHSADRIARDLRKTVQLSKSRALTLARTELANAYTEGQLDAFEAQGVEEFTVDVEWLTAGDDRVCDQCASLEGIVVKIEDARGMLPRHPNCRCAWVPITPAAVPSTSKTTTRQIKAAILKSVRSESPRRTKAEALRQSPWAGTDLLGKRSLQPRSTKKQRSKK